MPTSQLDTRIDRLCKDLIAQKWGDPNNFPAELNQAVWAAYRKFISGYLTFLRQKEAKPSDWFPEKLVIDWGLVDDMRHFFSDYQHITSSFLFLNRRLDRLRDIDRSKQPKLHQHMVTEILARTRE
jgi:hypothetical protein